MKEFVFRLSDGRAMLCHGDGTPCDRACFRIEDQSTGTLVLAGKQFPLAAEGVTVRAEELHGGVHTPALFVDGERYEAPPVSVGAGYLFFLPPTHAQLCRMEERLCVLEAAHTELARRLCRIEARMQDTNIF